MRRLKHTFLGILKALNRARVRYLVAGGMAVNLHGVPRATHDLDLYVDLKRSNLLRAIRALARIGLRPAIPESPEAIADPRRRARWRKEKGMVVLKFVDPDDPLHPVDVFVEHRIPFGTAWARRRVILTEGTKVPLISIHDLITLKRVANRRQDIADIEMLGWKLER